MSNEFELKEELASQADGDFTDTRPGPSSFWVEAVAAVPKAARLVPVVQASASGAEPAPAMPKAFAPVRVEVVAANVVVLRGY